MFRGSGFGLRALGFRVLSQRVPLRASGLAIPAAPICPAAHHGPTSSCGTDFVNSANPKPLNP